MALCATRTPHKRPECADETSKVGFRDELLTDEYLLKCLDDSGVSESRFANLRTKYHIIERIQAAIVILKECRCERDRQFYHALLTACAPVPVAFGCRSGWQRAIAELLGVNRQNATFVAAMQRRKEIDDAEASRVRSFRVGDDVITRHGPGKPTELPINTSGGDMGCTVELEHASHTYAKVGRGKGGAYLRRAPGPSFGAAKIEQRTDAHGDEEKRDVHTHFQDTCPTSPYARDQMRLRLGPLQFESRAAMIMVNTMKSIYASFKEKFSHSTISYSSFKRLKPWNLKRVKRETCLCKCCFNFSGYFKAFETLETLLKPMVDPAGDECGDEHDASSGQTDAPPKLVRMYNLAKTVLRKSELVSELLCDGAMKGGKDDCIKGKCDSCGFLRIWSRGVRRTLVHKNCGKDVARSGIDPTWLKTIKWSRVKSTGRKNVAEGSDKAEEGEDLLCFLCVLVLAS